ncbi:hypothetical protein HU200_012635 [Digitaria exilis]|uniref:Uncharacterized protein n=1 Tax=Digitaria exilis TaxID=1010633 RepID=A0A835FG14_9POAL|nr:hypothetical protein HU200_012635 [Digitaria exilis]
MEGRRSSVVFFLLALGIAAGSLAFLTQPHLPEAAAGKGSYMLVDMHAGRRGGDNARLAMRTSTGGAAVSMAGFANKKHRWFAVKGINNGYDGGSVGGVGQGLVTLLGALANNGSQ